MFFLSISAEKISQANQDSDMSPVGEYRGRPEGRLQVSGCRMGENKVQFPWNVRCPDVYQRDSGWQGGVQLF